MTQMVTLGETQISEKFANSLRHIIKLLNRFKCRFEDGGLQDYEVAILNRIIAAIDSPQAPAGGEAKLREAAQGIIDAQMLNAKGGCYSGWSITALNAAVEKLRSAMGLSSTPLSDETKRMMAHVDANPNARAALSSVSARDGEEDHIPGVRNMIGDAPAAPVATERLEAIDYARRWLANIDQQKKIGNLFPKETMRLLIAALAEPAPVGDGRAVGGEHAGRLVAVGDRKHDQYVCSCGWKSETWQDGHEWAEAAWLKHFADAQAAEKYKSRVFERRTQIDGGDQ